MSDINQHLLRRKIAKKNSYLNTKLKTKKQYQKMTEKEGYKVIPLPEEQDPMFQKRMNIYSEVYGKADEKTDEDKGAQRPRQKSQQRQNNHAAKAAAEAEAKTKEEAERKRAKSQKEREKSKKKHMERTKKGQPVMKNVINSLLAKVQKSMQKK